MEPHAKLYLLSEEEEGLFGDGKWRLLMAVKEHGSIQEAARSLGRGYRKAWGDIRSAEASFGRAIVKKKRGGAEGGATELTEFGVRLLDAWEKYRNDVRLRMNEAFEEYLKPIIGGIEDER